MAISPPPPNTPVSIVPEYDSTGDNDPPTPKVHENEHSKKLDSLVHRTNRILGKVSSVFPFDLFPDSVEVDENKVDIIIKQFIWFKKVYSLLIKDIKTVTLTSGLFFSTMFFEATGYEENPPTIIWLPKREAIRTRRIILGLITAQKEGIDVSKISVPDLVHKLEDIGKSRETRSI